MRNTSYPIIDLRETGQNIKKHMIASGYTVKDIQNFLGLGTPQGIYHWFEGKSLPALDNLYALSELFSVPMDTLIKGNRRYSSVAISRRFPNKICVYYENLLMLQTGCG